MTSRGKDKEEMPVTTIAHLITEIGHQLESSLRERFVSSCFTQMDPTGCGYLSRVDVISGAPPYLRTKQLNALRQLFFDNPTVHELSYAGFCTWLGTDTELFASFVGVLYGIMKRQGNVMIGLSWMRFKKAL